MKTLRDIIAQLDYERERLEFYKEGFATRQDTYMRLAELVHDLKRFNNEIVGTSYTLEDVQEARVQGYSDGWQDAIDTTNKQLLMKGSKDAIESNQD